MKGQHLTGSVVPPISFLCGGPAKGHIACQAMSARQLSRLLPLFPNRVRHPVDFVVSCADDQDRTAIPYLAPRFRHSRCTIVPTDLPDRAYRFELLEATLRIPSQVPME